MNGVDAAIFFSFILLIPMLVEKHLGRCGVIKQSRMFIIIGGMLWITSSCVSVLMYNLLGLGSTDGNFFYSWAYSVVIPLLQANNYAEVFKLLLSPGAWFYTTYQGIFYYFIGGTVISMYVINGFMAFWGGLILTRLVYSVSAMPPAKTLVLPILLIFPPSVLFWSSSNLKEGLMYWAICRVFAFVAPSNSVKEFWRNFLWFIGGSFIGVALRPHMIFFWVGSVLLVKVFQREFWKVGTVVILLLLTPLFIVQVRHRINFSSLELMEQAGERLMLKFIARGKNSTFEYGKHGPIPVLSGAINTLFRPFPWPTKIPRMIVAGLEIWSISIGILFVWIRMANAELRYLLKNPAIWVVILTCIPFFWFFTYTVNEGLIARQRIQFFPALLVLFASPVLLRHYRTNQRTEVKLDLTGGYSKDSYGTSRTKG